MANLTEIEDKVKTEEEKLDHDFKKQAWICVVIFAVILIVLCVAYCWNYPKFIWKDKWNLDAERFGQFGDFFGGVIGSIITLTSFFSCIMPLKSNVLQMSKRMKQIKR